MYVPNRSLHDNEIVILFSNLLNECLFSLFNKKMCEIDEIDNITAKYITNNFFSLIS